jgi:hypothetical protein
VRPGALSHCARWPGQTQPSAQRLHAGVIPASQAVAGERVEAIPLPGSQRDSRTTMLHPRGPARCAPWLSCTTSRTAWRRQQRGTLQGSQSLSAVQYVCSGPRHEKRQAGVQRLAYSCRPPLRTLSRLLSRARLTHPNPFRCSAAIRTAAPTGHHAVCPRTGCSRPCGGHKHLGRPGRGDTCDPQSPAVGILLQYHQGAFCGRAGAGCAFVCLGCVLERLAQPCSSSQPLPYAALGGGPHHMSST